MGSYIAHPKVNANTYQDAISQVGDQMDELWGNGHWKLVSCSAEPVQTTSGRTLTWEWGFEIVWLGLVPSA